MTVAQSLMAFSVAALLLSVTPGLDTALVVRTAAVEGARRALAAALGVAFGCLTWGAAVALGLGVLLAASELAFTVLKSVGAAYLVFLGVRMLLRPRSDLALETGLPSQAVLTRPLVWLRRGFLTNVLNPKVGVFYVSFLPQFLPADSHGGGFIFVLAAMHAVIGFAWFAVLVAALAPLSAMLRRAVVVRWLDRVTGGVFILFGLRLVLSQRPLS